MLSNVAMSDAPQGKVSQSRERTHASIVKLKPVSSSVCVSRLFSGDFTLAAHQGDNRVIVDLTSDELRELVNHMGQLLEIDGAA